MQQQPNSARVLYWPGMRRSPSELAALLQGLSADGYVVAWFDAPYDCGPPPNSPSGPVACWLDKHPPAEWWIGLSLGASVHTSPRPPLWPGAGPAG